VTARSAGIAPTPFCWITSAGPIQFESKGTSKTNDVIGAVDHWSIWEPV
jgi:hypothetical protein